MLISNNNSQQIKISIAQLRKYTVNGEKESNIRKDIFLNIYISNMFTFAGVERFSGSIEKNSTIWHKISLINSRTSVNQIREHWNEAMNDVTFNIPQLFQG